MPRTCKPGATVVVVGDGAVGLLGVLSAKQMGAERIIAMSRHEPRQKLAREFGATDIVIERGDEGVERVQAADEGHRRRFGARVRRHAGVDDAGDPLHAAGRLGRLRRRAARRRARRARAVLLATFISTAARRRCGAICPSLIDLVWNGKIDPGKVFDLTLPLEQVAEGYRAMDERRAIKTLLRP